MDVLVAGETFVEFSVVERVYAGTGLGFVTDGVSDLPLDCGVTFDLSFLADVDERSFLTVLF